MTLFSDQTSEIFNALNFKNFKRFMQLKHFILFAVPEKYQNHKFQSVITL